MPRHNNFSRIHATLWWFLVYFLYHCPATLRYQLVDATFDHVMVTYMLTYVYAWLWRRRCRQTLWKGLADLCHRYAKKNWSGPVTRKKCAKSWNSCRHWDLQGNPSSGFETFSNIDSMWNCSKPSVFFLSLSTSPSIQNGHKRTAPLRRWHNVCFGLSVNSTSVDTSGNSSEAMPGFESLQPEKGASAAEAWREWQKLQGLKPYGNHKRLIGFIITVWW